MAFAPGPTSGWPAAVAMADRQPAPEARSRVMWHRRSIVAIVLAGAVAATARPETPPADVLEVAPVWAGHPVGFSLLTVNDR